MTEHEQRLTDMITADNQLGELLRILGSQDPGSVTAFFAEPEVFVDRGSKPEMITLMVLGDTVMVIVCGWSSTGQFVDVRCYVDGNVWPVQTMELAGMAAIRPTVDKDELGIEPT